MMLAKVLYMGLQDPCHLGRGGKSHFFTKDKVLNSHALKNKGGPAWDIFHGCMKELPSIAIDTCLCYFHGHIINPRKILHFFTHMFSLQTNELINPEKFIPIYIIELHHNTNVCIHQAKLFIFLIQTKSLSIHMHVPSSSLVRQVCFPSLWFLWVPFTFYTHASSLQP
jgi:hypothetical protein